MPKISIIVPTYNNEIYLRECLESILNQTLKDIEIIVVNDGSTDMTPQIIEEYSQKDSRINIINKKNEGLGKAYNTGILAANGEYIGFIESDDFIDSSMYQDLYNIAKICDADMVKSSWWEYSTQNNNSTKDPYLEGYRQNSLLNLNEIRRLITLRSSIWSAIYKKSYLLKNNVFFLETPGASYQDVSFTYKAIICAKNIVVTNNAYVYYRQDNENSSINSKEKVNNIFIEYDEVNKFLQENKQYRRRFNDMKLIKEFNDYKWNLFRIKDCYKKQFLSQFKARFDEYFDNEELTNDFFSAISPYEYIGVLNLKI